ncbi:hypothetical protein Bequi_13875 [Brachybacterium sp. JHP9]|uniref:Uncharacterized protein n=1 Tax=Brachybacterium equifaecis TaxID=2910770 RepID=A0ABT0R3D5_9MICO|nr:hypothetical protein [Brachybacterium equifaecis]MCL6424454.1 hypothetical protein [Brachybacterium equifaecis]
MTTAPVASTESSMLALLHRRLAKDNAAGLPRWVYAEHVRALSSTREADAIALDEHAAPWSERKDDPDHGYHDRDVHGFEVKVSRADWLRELATHHPEFASRWKSHAWGRYCTHWWLVVPDPRIVAPGELPAGWGLLAGTARLRAVVPAAPRPAEPMAADLLHMVARTAIKTDRAYRGGAAGAPI